MADKEQGEEYEFEVPDFDEDAFIHKEIVSFKTTGILFVWGVVAALISYGIDEAVGGTKTGWYLGLLVAAAMGFALKFLYPALKIDISHFGRREWMGTGFLFFFSWLAFFILLSNPPFADHADPALEAFATPGLQQVGGDVTLDLFVTDNGKVDHFGFALTQGSTLLADESALESVGHGHYRYTLVAPSGGTYDYTITAIDSKGNNATLTGSIEVKTKAVTVAPASGSTLGPGDNLVVRFADPDFDPLNVYLLMDDGDRIYLKYTEEHEGWTATDRYAGWETGDNGFDVVAEEDNHFFGAILVPGGELRSGPYDITIEDAGGDITVDPLAKETVSPNTRRTPSLGVPIVVGALGLLAVASRRR